MSIASSQQSFLINALTTPHKPKKEDLILKFINSNVSCSINKNKHPPEHNRHEIPISEKQNQLVKLAVVTLAAGVLTLGSVHDASAAKTGGRVGGQAFRPSAPRSPSPRINNSRTNIYINPPIAPPLVGGYGYGYGVPFYGGWGWSPFSFFTPGPSVAIGLGGGFELLALFMFLGAATAVIRRVFGSRNQDEDDY